MSTLMTILSPAKTLDMESAACPLETSRPRLTASTRELARTLRDYTPKRLGSLMSISDSLASLNHERWQEFGGRTNPRGPAAICFRGDVYQGFEAWTLDKRSLAWAQDHVRILSGLYGLLRPLDTIQPYRLEMGTRLRTPAGSCLYDFWGSSITRTLKKDARTVGATALVNLASDEYAKAVELEALDLPVVSIRFLQREGGKEKFISIFAKRARGLMARWMAEHRPCSVADLSGFDLEGYRLNAAASGEEELVFTRPKPAAKKKAG